MRHFIYFVCLGYFTLCHLILGYFSRIKHKQRHTQTHSNKKILQSYLKRNTLKSNTLTPSNLKSNNLTLSSLIHSKPINLNKSNLKQYKRQCISLFICAHLVATPCAYALDNAPQPLEIAQVISSKPHITQPTLLHSSELVEQIPTPQPTAPQIITPQPATLQPTELQSPIPPPISPPNPQDSLLPHSLESNAILLESTLLHSLLADSPTQHLQDSHLSYPSLPSLDSSLPSKLESLDSLPITPDTSTRFLSPSITHSPNNIEIINITTPNAKGISNNHYIDFNIKPKSYTK